VKGQSLPNQEPSFLSWKLVTLDAACERLRARSADRRSPGERDVIAVTGHSGSGKTALARRLARTLGEAATVPIDNVASELTAFKRHRFLIEQVLEPFRQGHRVSWRFGPTVQRIPERCRWLILDGVGAAHDELHPYLSARVWIACDAAKARAREIALEGHSADAIAIIDERTAAERAFFSTSTPWEGADLIVCGTPEAPVPDNHVLVASDPPSSPFRKRCTALWRRQG